MDRRPTILDVAARAGVSKSTVSLVLKNSPQIKAETAARVRRAMQEVGYVYNRAAANLRSSSTGLIGLVINDLRNPFFTEFAASFQMALFARGYATVISNSGEDAAMQAAIIHSMIEHGVSALAISPAYGDVTSTFDQLARANVPTVQVLRQVSSRTDKFPFSSFDFVDGGGQAARHLIASGARRIAFVGGLEGRQITAERMSGYLSEMQRIGTEPIVLYGQPSRNAGAELAQQIMREHPQVDAAICFNDLVALGMMNALEREGQRVGEDFRLVGFDDLEESAQSLPPLSSVSCDITSFGEKTASSLLDWLTKGVVPPATHRQSVRLVTRASSGGRGV
ncbi:LacI family DNA-binding transcriptional regulator [Paracoccus tegillarcae]|uniref:LacI family transcriptional regulator n=1 Tax=Paracoccus tegillarcae TaxID=1529068 RepID=A0A2K9EYY1_9RHOB|nr:LacI family DNA-binding transcriptional regulator [Paracoccus tegillarcae]AUH33312.1 LacI family transcriptional regulator [Paracoccus tegillarcae]